MSLKDWWQPRVLISGGAGLVLAFLASWLLVTASLASFPCQSPSSPVWIDLKNTTSSFSTAVCVGQTIGWIEGFKAVSDIYCVAAGEFAGPNPELEQDPTLLDRDPYDRGWLYRLRGRPTELAMSVSGYIQHLDATIDRMLQDSQQEKSC